jgi:hypothetical protein
LGVCIVYFIECGNRLDIEMAASILGALQTMAIGQADKEF